MWTFGPGASSPPLGREAQTWACVCCCLRYPLCRCALWAAVLSLPGARAAAIPSSQSFLGLPLPRLYSSSMGPESGKVPLGGACGPSEDSPFPPSECRAMPFILGGPSGPAAPRHFARLCAEARAAALSLGGLRWAGTLPGGRPPEPHILP